MPHPARGITIGPSEATRTSTDHVLGHVALLVCAALLLSFLIGPLPARAWQFPLQSEQVVTGSSSGIAGAQTDDGTAELLTEADVAPDIGTAPSAQTITFGRAVSGTFPGDVTSEDGVFIHYRESPDEGGIGYRSNTGTDTVNSPKTRTWDGLSWSAETEQSTSGSSIRLVRMAWSPVSSTTRIVATLSDDGWIDAYVCTPACTVTNNIGQTWSAPPGQPQKRFDLAYEQVSGDALLVYGVLSTDTTRDIAYRTFVSGVWGAEQYLDDTGHSTDIQYSLIRLASRQGSDQIGLVGGDDTDDDANAWIWDGSAWGSSTEITATAENPQREQAAIAWESSSGHLLAVAVDGTNPENIVSKEYTTTWSGTSTLRCAGVGNNIRWLSLKPNPVATANDMVLAAGENANGLYTCYWTGSAWANLNTHDTAIDAAGTRVFDFAWESSGSKGLLVWGTTAGVITYRTFAAPNTWGITTNVAMGTNVHAWVSLRTNPLPQPGAATIVGAVMETTANDLGEIRWDGTTFTVTGASAFTADTGTTAYDSFDLACQATNDNELLVRYDFTGVPAGDAYTLTVKGYRTDEDIDVQVLTAPATWNTRIVLNAVTNTQFSYTLTTSEYNGGAPAVRFVGAVPSPDALASDLFLDAARIITVNYRYQLEVRQNITGIMSGRNPMLLVKGNVSAGGENFNVEAWNFTTSAWNLLLAAPFASVNAYHNTSVAPGFLSGGVVRIRYLDAGLANTVQGALSLDFVAVDITNGPGTLTNRGAAPTTGNISSAFVFFVRYRDLENEAPSFVNLTLAGISYAMVANNTADANYADGKDYYLVRTIGVRGTFAFFFSTRASAGDVSVTSTPTQTIAVVNRVPTITNPIAIDGVHTGRPYGRTFSATDLDGDTLTWSLATNASWLSVGPSNGTVWGSAPTVTGSFSVNVTVSDGFGGAAWDAYTLSVGNLPPRITNPISAASSARRASYVRSFAAVDADADLLMWSLRSNASFLAIGAGNATVYGVTPNVPARYWVEVRVSDGHGGTDLVNFTLTVVNAPPTISVSGPSTVTEGDAYLGTLSGSDPDGDSLSWSLATNASWLSLDAPGGALHGVAVVGTYYANVTVRDPYGGTAYRNVTIVVSAASPPTSGTGNPWTALTVLILGAGAFVVAILFAAKARRRSVLEQAFLLNETGEVRFAYTARYGPLDEPSLRARLANEDWQHGARIPSDPYTLHLVHRPEGHWVLVSRSDDDARVQTEAESVFALANADLSEFIRVPPPPPTEA